MAVSGRYLIHGEDPFGSATGDADRYLVPASLGRQSDGASPVIFIMDNDAKGARGTATHGLIVEDVITHNDDALAIPASYTELCKSAVAPLLATNWRGLRFLPELRVPCINAACVWHALRACGIKDRISGRGGLLEEH